MLKGEHARVHNILEVGQYESFVPDLIEGERRYPGWEIHLFDDRLVLSVRSTPEAPRRERAGERAWVESSRIFGRVLGLDLARPGVYRQHVQPKPTTPGDVRSALDDLEYVMANAIKVIRDLPDETVKEMEAQHGQ